MVRQIHNHCPNNQMRDVFFEEVETDDPVSYVRSLLKGKVGEITEERFDNGKVTVWANCEGIVQEFVFTPF